MRVNHLLPFLAVLLPLTSFADPSLGRWTTTAAIGTTDSGENWVSATSTAVPLVIPSSLLGFYFFRIDAPVGVTVPVGIDYYFGGQLSANSGASASIVDTLKVVNVFTDTLTRSINTAGQVGGSTLGQHHKEMQLVAGNVYQVQLLVNATVGGVINGATNTFATAYVDPYIAINSSFLSLHPEYAISFSDGVINAVPEPSTSALLLAGVVGFCARSQLRLKAITNRSAVRKVPSAA